MVKCSNCKQIGHNKAKCPNEAYVPPLETAMSHSISIILPQVASTRMSKLGGFCEEVAITLGKGYVEGVYQQALGFELQQAGIPYVTEETIPILYKGKPIGGGLHQRLDVSVQREWLPFIYELKAVKVIEPQHHWQLVRYMAYKQVPYGAVVNFSQSDKGSFEIQFIVLHEGQHYLYDAESQTGRPLIDYSLANGPAGSVSDDASTEEE